MCPHSEKPKGFPIGDMPYEMVEDILKQGKGKAKSVKFNWRGEPTLYKKLPEAINLAKELGYVDIMMNTNGNYSPTLNEKLGNLTYCAFSIDTIYEGRYPELRRNGSWWACYENMMGLKSKYPKMRIIAQQRLQEVNKNEARQFKYYFEELGFETNISHAMKRTAEGSYVIRDTKATGRRNCFFAVRRLTISFDGEVFPCCAAGWQSSELSLGNIKNITLQKAWDSLKMQDIRVRLKHNSFNNFGYEDCKNCYSKEAYIWKK